MDEITASEAAAVLPVWLKSAAPGWPRPAPGQSAAAFLAGFRRTVPQDGTPSLITGYYEPEIEARAVPGAGFDHPLYRLPPDPGFSHAEIAAGALAGQGLELAWIADPVDAFFLQVQGSGRLRLPDGVLRLGYAGKNGHPYRSLGREMIARGLIAESEISARAIRDWLAAHPDQVTDLLLANPSFVYFRPLDLAPDDGPIGTAGVPLTTMRSLAVDPAHIPLGALVLLETRIGGAEIRRLMVAQDTGGVIKGAQRADIFFGTGHAAGEAAGQQNAPGRLTVLLPDQP
jgi:membrane-bound lytic murein transglycosylase A